MNSPPPVDPIPADLPLGESWPVLCVRGKFCKRMAWWPVIGPFHEDAEVVGFPMWHFHVDFRFVSYNQWANITSFLPKDMADGDTLYPKEAFAFAHVLTLNERGRNFSRPFESDQSNSPTYGVRRKMYRSLFPQYPTLRALNAFVMELQKVYADKRGCAVCPHRGLRLDGPGLERLKNGARVCPGHGLHWNPDGSIHTVKLGDFKAELAGLPLWSTR